MTYHISSCDEKGFPMDGPIKCAVCGRISKNEGGHKHHIAVHRRDKPHSYHDERLLKSEKHTAGVKPTRALYEVRLKNKWRYEI